MTVRVDQDGTIVHLFHGTQLVGAGKNLTEVPVTSSHVAGEGETFADDEVAPYVLEHAKAGERGYSHVSDKEFEKEQEALRKEAEDSTEADAREAEFDPSEHVQDDVLEHLKTADEDEVARVQAAEKDGQARQKIMGFKPEGS